MTLKLEGQFARADEKAQKTAAAIMRLVDRLFDGPITGGGTRYGPPLPFIGVNRPGLGRTTGGTCRAYNR